MLRENPGLWSELVRIDDRDELYDTIVESGREMGYALDPAHVRTVSPEDFLALINEHANDDELTDEELELVAAGLPIMCTDT